MGRNQTFNTTDAARAARDVFWSTGYEQASLPELEAATGLNRSSIYNTFGSKRGLFDAAVQNYLDEVIRPHLKPLHAPTINPDAVVNYLNGLRHAISQEATNPTHNGCLLINTAGAPIARDAEVQRVIAAYRAELHTAIAAGIRARHPQRPESTVETLAQTTTALVVFAMTMARVDSTAASNALTTAIAGIDA